MELTADVVVVGARCAGAATAMLLARAGHDVLLLDRLEFPADTVSTHVIARSGMVMLDRWGLVESVVASGAPMIHEVSFTGAEGSQTRRIKDRHGVSFLLAPRRTKLDVILQREAAASGVRLVTRTAVHDVLRDARGRIVGVCGVGTLGPLTVRARWVVGADGLNSRVARCVGAPLTLDRPATGAAQYAYYDGDWSAIEHHLGDGAFGGVFPTHDRQACVWVCAPPALVRTARGEVGRWGDALAHLLRDRVPSLVHRLQPGAKRTEVRGMLRLPNQRRAASGPGWALVGDAGCHRDAITGHGMSDAFRDAELLAVALDRALRDPSAETVELTAYERERDRLAGPIFDLTCAIAAFPEPTRFVDLQRQLAVAIDDLAQELRALPSPPAVSAA